MNCQEALEQLYAYLDEDCTVEVKTAIRHHIEECGDCFGHYEFERTFLLFVEARCKAKAAPANLRKRIFEQILLEREPGA